MRAGQTVGHIAGTELFQIIDRVLILANEIGCNSPRILTAQDAGRSRGSQLSANFDERRFARGEKQVADF